MTRIEGSVVIHAPVQKVFAFAADWRKWPDWFEGVSNFRPTTDVIRGNGARYAYRARLIGIPAAVETEIHDFVENAGWTGVATKGVPHKTQWVFETQGDDTRFTYILEYELRVPLIGALLNSLLIEREWRRIINKSLRNLKTRFPSERNSDSSTENKEGA